MESVFDEYFENSKAPDESVLTAAKNSIKKPRTQSRVWKRILATAACAALALASIVGMVYLPSTVNGIIAGIGNSNNTANTQIEYYGTEGLEEVYVDVYADDAPSGLGFVKKLDYAKNYSVNSVDGYCSDGDLAYVKTKFTAVVNGSRHDTVIYTEYTQKYSVCELFEEYYGGETSYYDGYRYLYFDTEDNGEPVKKLTFERGGVKYYVEVTSSDANAYRTWLDLIIK